MLWGEQLRRALGRGPHSGRSRIADVDATVLGVHPPAASRWVERHEEQHLQSLVAGESRLVVVRGPGLSGKSHLLARTTRTLLGDHVAVWSDLLGVDGLGSLLDAARRAEGPVVVWLDDAPPTVLDLLTPELVSSLSEGVRLFVTVSEERLPAYFPDPGTVALLDDEDVTVRIGPLNDDETARAEVLAIAAPGGLIGAGLSTLGDVRAALTPGDDGLTAELFALRIAADWRRFGCPGAPTPHALARITEHAVRRSATPDGLTSAVEGARRLRAGPRRLLTARRRGADEYAVIEPLTVVVADEPGGAASWRPADAFVLAVADTADGSYRAAAGRIALTRGDLALARRLVSDADPSAVSPALALEVAGPASWSADRRRAWLRRALEASDPDVERRAQRALARLEEDDGDLPAAREHLEALADEPDVWASLARTARAAGEVDEARRWYQRIVDEGGPDPAAALADRADLEMQTQGLDPARPWFTVALKNDPQGIARRRWARAEMRAGNLDQAHTIAEGSPTNDAWGRGLTAGIDVLRGRIEEATTTLTALSDRYSVDRPALTYALALRCLTAQRHWLAVRLLLCEDDLESAPDIALFGLARATYAEWIASNSEARWKYQDIVEDHESPEIVVGVACARLARMNLLADHDSVRQCRARMRASTHPGVLALEDEFSRDFDAAIENYLWR